MQAGAIRTFKWKDEKQYVFYFFLLNNKANFSRFRYVDWLKFYANSFLLELRLQRGELGARFFNVSVIALGTLNSVLISRHLFSLLQPGIFVFRPIFPPEESSVLLLRWDIRSWNTRYLLREWDKNSTLIHKWKTRAIPFSNRPHMR